MTEDNLTERVPVSSSTYDEAWIRETWGWDTPETFIESQGRNLRPRVRRSIEIAQLRPGMRVLDIGCGRGEVVLHCARNGMEAVGADYSERAIDLAEKARVTHTAEEQARMHFVCGDVKVLTSDEPFDRIFMLDLVEHLYDWELAELFGVCSRLLAPEGVIIIHTLPNRWVYEITYRRLLRLFMPWLPPNPRSKKEMAIHVNEMSIIHLARILDDAGYAQRVWLQDLMVEQARWMLRGPLDSRRKRLYRLLANPMIGTCYQLVAKTALRPLVVNDIFAVAWQSGRIPSIRAPFRLTEHLLTKRRVAIL